MTKNLYIAFITVFLWALYDVSVRYVGVTWNVQPLVFVSYTSLVAALTLLTVAGKGPLGISTIREPHTWGFSFVSVFMDIIFVFILLNISTTEATLLIRFSIIISALICWGLLGRKIKPLQYIGFALILIGCWLVASGLPSEIQGVSLFLLAIVIICQAIRTLIVETHPSSNKAEKWHDNFRVTGYVMLVTSFAFLVFGFFTALFKSSVDAQTLEAIPIMASFPVLSDFVQPATLLAAFVLGVTNVSISNYFYFQSTKKIGSDVFLMVAAALPIFAFGMEWLASTQGLLDITSIDERDLFAGILITAGALWGVLVHAKFNKIKVTTREQRWHNHVRDLVLSTLLHFNKDEKLAAKALGVNTTTIKHLLKKTKTFKKKTLDKITDNFAHNVMSRDPLTGLQNRLMFMTSVEKAIEKDVHFGLIFIDLDKFKPVNDTYGHDAGDAVLKAIGERLHQSYQHIAEVTRLGGDEFCILIYKAEEEEMASHIQEVNRLIRLPIVIDGIEEPIEVSASAGFGLYPKNGKKLSDILKHADKNMYENKKPR